MLGVAIVHYHAESLLADCLRSLLASEVRPDRVCVVDNGSRDGLGWVPRLDPSLRVIRAPGNIGFGAASNMALAHLREADHVLLLNPDVSVPSGTLGAMLAVLGEDASLGAATCRLLRPSGELDPACRRSDPTLLSGLARYLSLPAMFPGSATIGAYNLTYLDETLAHDIGSGTAAFLLLTRAALDAVRGFDERFFLYGEDLDLCRRIRQAGLRVRYDPRATAVHVKGSGRIRSLQTTRHFYSAIWIYYRKWGRFRRNPVVLGGLGALLALLFAREAAANAVRRGLGTLGRHRNPRQGASPSTDEGAAG
ncbi:MAG: glycosyltransferase family 2 protein [Vicinamibacterales bacterium]